MFPLDPNASGATTAPRPDPLAPAAGTVGRDSQRAATARKAPDLLKARAIGGAAWVALGIAALERFANGRRP